MSPKIQATRTVNPLHFEDLEPHRFEDLVRQLAYGFRTWRSLEATGRLGSDEGIDVRGIETVPLVSPEEYDELDSEEIPLIEERIWIIQCKRYQKITPKVMKQIVSEATSSETPYGLIIAVACDVTKASMDAFRTEARMQGIQVFELWTKARLEDLLFQPRFDNLLFAYFNISLAMKRLSRLTSVRKMLTIKRKLRSAFGEEDLYDLFKNILVRDIEDVAYPYKENVPEFSRLEVPPWHLAEVKVMGIRGIVVARKGFVGRVTKEGTWDIAENSPNALRNQLQSGLSSNYDDYSQEKYDWERARDLRASVPQDEEFTVLYAELIPYENILEVDPNGDSLHPIVQLYCNFYGQTGPYDVDRRMYLYYAKTGGLQQLAPEKRVVFFET